MHKHVKPVVQTANRSQCHIAIKAPVRVTMAAKKTGLEINATELNVPLIIVQHATPMTHFPVCLATKGFMQKAMLFVRDVQETVCQIQRVIELMGFV